MGAVITTLGLVPLTASALGKTAIGTLSVHLFVNNITPDITFINITATEMTMSGYAAINLTPASWSITSTGGICTATYPSITFSMTTSTSQTIFGYWIKDSVSGLGIWADTISPSFTVPGSGGSFTLNLTLQDLNCSS